VIELERALDQVGAPGQSRAAEVGEPTSQVDGPVFDVEGAGVVEGDGELCDAGSGVEEGALVVDGIAGVAEVVIEEAGGGGGEGGPGQVVEHPGAVVVEVEVEGVATVADGAGVAEGPVQPLGVGGRDGAAGPRRQGRRPAARHRTARPGQRARHRHGVAAGQGAARLGQRPGADSAAAAKVDGAAVDQGGAGHGVGAAGVEVGGAAAELGHAGARDGSAAVEGVSAAVEAQGCAGRHREAAGVGAAAAQGQGAGADLNATAVAERDADRGGAGSGVEEGALVVDGIAGVAEVVIEEAGGGVGEGGPGQVVEHPGAVVVQVEVEGVVAVGDGAGVVQGPVQPLGVVGRDGAAG